MCIFALAIVDDAEAFSKRYVEVRLQHRSHTQPLNLLEGVRTELLKPLWCLRSLSLNSFVFSEHLAFSERDAVKNWNERRPGECASALVAT